MEEFRCEVRGVVQFQVHRQESQFRGDIARPQAGAELDAINNGNPLVEKIDMVAAEIAVSLADPILLNALLHKGLMFTKKGLAELLNTCVLLLTDRLPDKAGSFMKVICYCAPDRFRGAIECCICCCCRGMEVH